MTDPYIAGIDECGTGELAGPITVCGFSCPDSMLATLSTMVVRDSKETTPEQRDYLYRWALMATLTGKTRMVIESATAEEINRLGPMKARDKALSKVINQLAKYSPAPSTILVDGSLVRRNLPEGITFKDGSNLDRSDVRVAAASMLAKAGLDQYWQMLHRVYPDWDFPSHHGAASPHHIEMLRRHGPFPGLHRTGPVKSLMQTLKQGGGPRGLKP